MPARSRRTVDLATVPALSGATFSTVMEADQNVALDRLMAWDARGLAAAGADAMELEPRLAIQGRRSRCRR